MADQHQRAALCGETRLQPLDGRQVEVVGRLVQQQDVRPGRQHVGQRCPAQLAARQQLRILGTVQAQLLQQVARLMGIVRGPEAGFDIGKRGGVA